MDEKGKLESNFLTIVHFHVIDGHKVLMEVPCDEPFHQLVSTLLKELFENKRLLLVQRKMVQNNPLQNKVLKVNFLSEDGVYCFNSLPAIKHVE